MVHGLITVMIVIIVMIVMIVNIVMIVIIVIFVIFVIFVIVVMVVIKTQKIHTAKGEKFSIVLLYQLSGTRGSKPCWEANSSNTFRLFSSLFQYVPAISIISIPF
jgi:hypothetical protein